MMTTFSCLNTYHVIVQQLILKQSCLEVVRLNTYHVIVQPQEDLQSAEKQR